MTTDFTIREAIKPDLKAIVALLADDALGKGREDLSEETFASYERAFADIQSDPRHMILVAEQDGEIIGCLQLSFLPGLTYRGQERAQIEGVRVAAGRRRRGIGRALVLHAIDLARERKSVLVQLATHRQRADAAAFYEALGFTESHRGMKLWFAEDKR